MSDAPTSDGWLAFQSRDFRYFFGSRFLSSLAAMMIDVGVGWMVYARTNSVFALGLVGLFAFLPNVLFMLAVGHTADRYDRRQVLLLCYGANTLASTGLIWCAASPAIDVSFIYAMILLFGTARAFANPASQAILPMIIRADRHRLSRRRRTRIHHHDPVLCRLPRSDFRHQAPTRTRR